MKWLAGILLPTWVLPAQHVPRPHTPGVAHIGIYASDILDFLEIWRGSSSGTHGAGHDRRQTDPLVTGPASPLSW